jgi:hypothetical protein
MSFFCDEKTSELQIVHVMTFESIVNALFGPQSQNPASSQVSLILLHLQLLAVLLPLAFIMASQETHFEGVVVLETTKTEVEEHSHLFV